jgi:hypothetical protein
MYLASIAVKDLKVALAWYQQLFGRQGNVPMPDLAEWEFAPGGWLQVYRLPKRAGQGSFTLAVSDIAAETNKLAAWALTRASSLQTASSKQ